MDYRVVRYLSIFFIHIFFIISAWLVTSFLYKDFLGSFHSLFFTHVNFFALLFFVQLSSIVFFRLHRTSWRYTSIQDLSQICKTGLVSFLVPAIVQSIVHSNEQMPTSFLFTDTLLFITFIGGTRFLYRRINEKTRRKKVEKIALIVGAGEAGERIARDFTCGGHTGIRVMGFLDDDQRKKGQEIHRIRVLGPVASIEKYAKKWHVDMIIIAMPSANPKQIRKILQYCTSLQMEYRILPSLVHFTDGKISVSDLREVSLEDLLGRETVKMDSDFVEQTLNGQIVLISGGGGSIGSELCRQIIENAPKQLIIVDNCEHNLYQIDLELKTKYPQANIASCLVDVTDLESLKIIFNQFRPDFVFHAAAYKHVPLLENQLRVAVRNNIFGSCNIADLAVTYEVKTFVLVSTDKAVNPTNVMGMTKRVAEIYCQSLAAQAKTKFITVRFGNVLGSVGSVIPLFKQQIKKGGPLTVTHAEMKRYFMTIPEAASLILEAGSFGKGGEIFVLDMGEPVKIRDLAEQLIRFSGKEPYKDIDIQFTGLRPGEKMFEELFYEGENIKKTNHKKIHQAQSREFDGYQLKKNMQKMRFVFEKNEDEALFLELNKLVPEYCRMDVLRIENVGPDATHNLYRGGSVSLDAKEIA